MPVSRFTLTDPLRHMAGAAAMLALAVSGVFVITWAFAHTLARNSDTIQASEFAATVSPGDPLARYRYAAALERTFDLESITRSLAEYEAAVAAAPDNFVYWLGLGQARERDGDRPGAELAYRRALELAPSYARTRWALGNNLVRQGRTADGVELIRSAVDQDPAFAAPAVIAAMQAFDGDVTRATTALGSNPRAVAELVKYLVNAGRFDEGLGVWNSLEPGPGSAAIREAGVAVRAKFLEAKRFRDAARLTSTFESDTNKRPAIGALANGGFETGVATQNVDFFDWQIGQPYPIFGLSDTQPKEGKYSLLVRFTTPSRLEFASVSRTVAVEPDAVYDLSIAYRSELTTRAEFRWEIISAADAKRLVISDPVTGQTGWTDLHIRFTVPADIDGVTLRLIREKCDSAACTVSGTMWFDDFRLNKI